MKKFLGFLLVLVIIVAIAGQYLLPKYIGMRIEDQLDESLHPSDQTVVVESILQLNYYMVMWMLFGVIWKM